MDALRPSKELPTQPMTPKTMPTPAALYAAMDRVQRDLLLWVLTTLEADGPKTDRELMEVWLTIRPRDLEGYRAAVYGQLARVTRRADELGLVEIALTDDGLGWTVRLHWRERLQELTRPPNAKTDI